MANSPCAPRPDVPFAARVLLFVVPFAAIIGCQTLGSVDPDPIEVASSGERTDDAIRDALRRDGWEIETWSPGEIFAGKTSDGEPLRIRIHHDDGELKVSWIDDGSLDGTIEENNERKREIRRALRNLADRIEYHIESVDLEARNDDAWPSASLRGVTRSSTTPLGVASGRVTPRA
jgi:hypothetical protein